jgi:hypothetical protein
MAATHATRPSRVSTVKTWRHGSCSSMLSIERGLSAASRSRTRRPPRRSAGWSRTSAFEWARQMAGQDASPQTAGQNDDDVSAQREVQNEGFSSIPDGHEQPQESFFLQGSSHGRRSHGWQERGRRQRPGDRLWRGLERRTEPQRDGQAPWCAQDHVQIDLQGSAREEQAGGRSLMPCSQTATFGASHAPHSCSTKQVPEQR